MTTIDTHWSTPEYERIVEQARNIDLPTAVAKRYYVRKINGESYLNSDLTGKKPVLMAAKDLLCGRLQSIQINDLTIYTTKDQTYGTGKNLRTGSMISNGDYVLPVIHEGLGELTRVELFISPLSIERQDDLIIPYARIDLVSPDGNGDIIYPDLATYKDPINGRESCRGIRRPIDRVIPIIAAELK
jgi:hypothetical protein